MINTFSYIGSNTSHVFTSAYPYLVELWGAEAEYSDSAGYVNAIMSFSSNTTYYVFVGGSTAGTGTPWNGGWNGGGAGGAINAKAERRGAGGGGMSEIRTSTSTTASYKLLVAGGAGGGIIGTGRGGGAGQSGEPTYPTTIADDGSRQECGGEGGFISKGGAGGLAPITYADSYTPSDTYYVSSGGGGGGGYYGGGGGSTGYIVTTSSKTYGAGSAGSLGQGGAGGSSTTAVSGYNYEYSGGGGGGSNYIGTTNILSSSSSMVTNNQPDNPYYYYHGCVRLSQIISTPIIKSVERDGDYYIVEIGKSNNNGIEELFYCYVTNSSSYRITGLENLGYGRPYIITNDETITIKHKINYSTSSTINTFVSATNGRDFVNETYTTNAIIEVPTLATQDSKLEEVYQGKSINNIFSFVKTDKHKGTYKLQTTLTFPESNHETITIDHTENDPIYFPILYDGTNNEEYKVNLKTRAYQTADTTNGIGKEIEIGTFKQDNIVVKMNKEEVNNIVIKTKLKDVKMAKDTVLSLDWVVDDPNSEVTYKITMFDNENKVVQDFYVTSSEIANNIKIPLSYLQGEYYFSICKMKNETVVTTPIYTDSFYIYQIVSEEDIILSDLHLQTKITTNFKKIVVKINDIARYSETVNLDINFPIWMFKNGENKIIVEIFFDDNNSVSYDYKAVTTYSVANSIESQVDITSFYSINDNEEELFALKKELEDTLVDLEYKEITFRTKQIESELVDSITQKITISKKEGITIIPQIATIIGSVE